ncbi:hypothetical protein MRB53_037803 [Persea americana]|nr:hypothetical protein MRB53_037803 [Persea americana]
MKSSFSAASTLTLPPSDLARSSISSLASTFSLHDSSACPCYLPTSHCSFHPPPPLLPHPLPLLPQPPPLPPQIPPAGYIHSPLLAHILTPNPLETAVPRLSVFAPHALLTSSTTSFASVPSGSLIPSWYRDLVFSFEVDGVACCEGDCVVDRGMVMWRGMLCSALISCFSLPIAASSDLVCETSELELVARCSEQCKEQRQRLLEDAGPLTLIAGIGVSDKRVIGYSIT